MEFFLGIVCGIALSLFCSFGPSFFSELQTSIHYGFKKSFPFAFGINMGDILIVGLLLTVLQNADMDAILHNVYVATIGGIVLAGMGLHTFFRKAEKVQEQGTAIKFKTDDPKRFGVYLRGLFINFCNPLIWIYWISIIAVISGELDIPTNHMYLFFAGILCTTLSLDILKCKIASLLQQVITAKMLNTFNKIIGGILIGFAIYMVASMVIYQTRGAQEETKKNTSTHMVQKIIENSDSTKTKFINHK